MTSDHTELVKRLRVNRDWDTVGLTKQAANAIEEQNIKIKQLETRLEAEVRAHHVIDGARTTTDGGWCRCKKWQDDHAAHVNEAVAEALGGQP